MWTRAILWLKEGREQLRTWKRLPNCPRVALCIVAAIPIEVMWPVRVPLTTVASVRGRPGHPSLLVSFVTPNGAEIELGHPNVVVEHLARHVQHHRVDQVLPEQWHARDEVLAQCIGLF
eukprot:COSAG02_NODE_28834_length_581_cov_1.128631_1_plen_118_part_10